MKNMKPRLKQDDRPSLTLPLSQKIPKTRYAYLFSALILVSLIVLAALLLNIEQDALFSNVEATSDAVAVGLSSIAIEGIGQNRRQLIKEYCNNVKQLNIKGLATVDVIEYKKRQINGASVITQGIVVGSFSLDHINEAVDPETLTAITAIEERAFREVSINKKTYFNFGYPIVWQTNERLPEETIGFIQMRFDKKIALGFFTRAQSFSIAFAIGVIALIVFLILLSSRLTAQLKNALKEVSLLSITDPLTEIFNRKQMDDALEIETERAERYDKPFTLIMFDIDFFKVINDTHGHDIGDKALVKIAGIVKEQIRNVDVFARWGGEEFLILLPETPLENATLFMERIRRIIEEYQFSDVERITISAGLTEFKKGDTPDAIVKRVDTALYEAKHAGRNRSVAMR